MEKSKKKIKSGKICGNFGRFRQKIINLNVSYKIKDKGE